MQRALKPTPRRRSGGPPGHGQNIYAYCNIRTRQVLYSLSRSLDSHQSLKQLPDLGPNTVPPKLRKDVWKPLYTLALPPVPALSTSVSEPPSYNTHAQGLDAFRKLREYRKLHETNWTPPEELSRLYSKDEIKALEDKYEARGGSKKESVYDIIKREKKKLRRVVVMDQKANSIADLAAVLIQQERRGQEREAEQREERRAERLREVREMLSYAEMVERLGFKGLDAKIGRFQEMVKMSPEGLEMKRKEAGKNGARVPTSKRQAKHMLHQLIRKKARMQFAARAVRMVHERMAGSMAILAELRNAKPEDTVSDRHPEVENALTLPRAHPKTYNPSLRYLHKMQDDPLALKQRQEYLRYRLDHTTMSAEKSRRRLDLNTISDPAALRAKIMETEENMLNLRTEAASLGEDTKVSQEVQEAVQHDVAVTGSDQPEAEDVVAAGRDSSSTPSHGVTTDEKQLELDKKEVAIKTAQDLVDESAVELRERFEVLATQLDGFNDDVQALEQSGASKLEKDKIQNLTKERELVTARLVVVGHALTAMGIDPSRENLIIDEEATMDEQEDNASIDERRVVTKEEANVDERVGSSQISASSEGSSAVTEGSAKAGDSEAASQRPTTNEENSTVTSNVHGLPKWHSLLPSFPTPNTSPYDLPKHDKNRHKLMRLNKPVFSMEGVKVQWANILDAEFAEAWPATVEHEHMGMVRHTANPPGYKAKMTVLDVNKHLVERALERGEMAPEELGEGAGSAHWDAEAAAEARKAARRAAEEDAEAQRKALVQQLTDEVVGKLKERRLPRVKTAQQMLSRRERALKARKEIWQARKVEKKAQRQAESRT